MVAGLGAEYPRVWLNCKEAGGVLKPRSVPGAANTSGAGAGGRDEAGAKDGLAAGDAPLSWSQLVLSGSKRLRRSFLLSTPWLTLMGLRISAAHELSGG